MLTSVYRCLLFVSQFPALRWCVHRAAVRSPDAHTDPTTLSHLDREATQLTIQAALHHGHVTDEWVRTRSDPGDLHPFTLACRSVARSPEHDNTDGEGDLIVLHKVLHIFAYISRLIQLIASLRNSKFDLVGAVQI
jgi:hypothetical protein